MPKTLKLSGEVINWGIKDIMSFFEKLKIFGCWYRERDLMWMYFPDVNKLRQAENLLRNSYPQITFTAY
jgi:hypothetical protein